MKSIFFSERCWITGKPCSKERGNEKSFDIGDGAAGFATAIDTDGPGLITIEVEEPVCIKTA